MKTITLEHPLHVLAEKWRKRMRKLKEEMRERDEFGDSGGYMMAELEYKTIQKCLRELRATMRKNGL